MIHLNFLCEDFPVLSNQDVIMNLLVFFYGTIFKPSQLDCYGMCEFTRHLKNGTAVVSDCEMGVSFCFGISLECTLNRS